MHDQTSPDAPPTGSDPVLDVYERQLVAMDAGDTASLRALFTPDAHLVHMTGRVQPLDDWMRGMDARQFVYHRVVRGPVQVVARTDVSARVVGHVTTGVTDDGSGQAWPLRMEQDYRLVAGRWLCTESRVTFDG